MYEALTTTELTVLQSILFEGTEQAYRVTNLNAEGLDCIASYQAVHAEVGRAFLEAGLELLGRLDSRHEAKAA